MEKVLNAEARDGAGVKSVLNAFRNGAKIPATVYGEKQPNLNVSVDGKEFIKIVSKDPNAIIRLKCGGKEESVLIKSVQKHVVTDDIIHVDFMRISLTHEIEVQINVHLVGEPVGVKNQGGILFHGLREVTVKCLPGNIPSEIKVDVAGMQINDVIKVKDIKLEKKGVILENPDTIVASISAPRAEKEEAPTPAAAEAEPEVVEKGKKEEAKEEKAGSSPS